MARSPSPSKPRSTSTTTKPNRRAAPVTTSTSRSAYLREYRAKRLASPQLRLQKKLKLLTKKELAAVEQSVDTILGPKRLPEPKNPWALDRQRRSTKSG